MRLPSLYQRILGEFVFQKSLLSIYTEETVFLNDFLNQKMIRGVICLTNLSGFNGLGPSTRYNKLYYFLLKMLIIFL